eukprot:gene6226-6863_t
METTYGLLTSSSSSSSSGKLLVLSSKKVIASRMMKPCYALDPKIKATLEEMKEKYDHHQLNHHHHADGGNHDVENNHQKEVVEKYNTYLEVQKILIKLRIMLQYEASQQRKAKQLKNFIDLYKGKLEIENVLCEKLGYPPSNTQVPPELQEYYRREEEVRTLQSKLEKVEIKLAPGKSSIEAYAGL